MPEGYVALFGEWLLADLFTVNQAILERIFHSFFCNQTLQWRDDVYKPIDINSKTQSVNAQLINQLLCQ
jgi:hypothetical protein